MLPESLGNDVCVAFINWANATVDEWINVSQFDLLDVHAATPF